MKQYFIIFLQALLQLQASQAHTAYTVMLKLKLLKKKPELQTNIDLSFSFSYQLLVFSNLHVACFCPSCYSR